MKNRKEVIAKAIFVQKLQWDFWMRRQVYEIQPETMWHLCPLIQLIVIPYLLISALEEYWNESWRAPRDLVHSFRVWAEKVVFISGQDTIIDPRLGERALMGMTRMEWRK